MSCEKTTYRGGRLARREARKLKDSTGMPFRAYACPACGRWHLSTTVSYAPGQGPGIGAEKTRPRRASSLEELKIIAQQLRQRRTEEEE